MKTLLVDSTARPVRMVDMDAAVCRMAAAIVEGVPTPQVLVAHPELRYRSQHLVLEAPWVLMVPEYVELRDAERAKVTRRVLYARDRYTCQYCGFVAPSIEMRRRLTLDHVKPVRLFDRRDAATTWDNVTTACRDCNQVKGGRLPMECGMYPSHTPKEPHFVQLHFAGRLNAAQRDYVLDYYQWDEDEMLL